MFYNSYFNQPLNNWNVSNVTDMSFMFMGNDTFNHPLNNWNVSNVTDMGAMFMSASNFNQNISSWDVSNTTSIAQIFADATSFNEPLNNWNVSNVLNFNGAFTLASSFNQPLDNWNTSLVTDMNAMFYLAEAFDQDLSSWDVSNVSNMEDMLSLSGISESNYDNTIIGWAGQNVLNNISLGAQNLIYCNSYNERQSLIDNFGWSFVGDQISANCSFSIEDIIFNSVKIYPNPVIDVLNIFGNNELYDIQIFNLNGKKIMSAFKVKNLKLNSLDAGIYILKVFDDSSTRNFKIIKF